jgi:hypothetical protein
MAQQRDVGKFGWRRLSRFTRMTKTLRGPVCEILGPMPFDRLPNQAIVFD